MAEFNANIVVQPFDINVTLDQPGITVTPNVTSLNVYTAGGTNGVPAGNIGDLQYYAANGFAAVPSNVANYTGGNLNLNVNNLSITGGNNGYVLQTDGTGNISWTAPSGGGGNGSPGGSNTQIQYNDNGLFGGSTGFTFNKTSNLVSMPGSLSVVDNVTANTLTGSLVTAAQPNITSIGTLSSLNVTGNVVSGNISANTVSVTNFSANTLTGLIVTAAQPNITSVGTLTNLNVNGNITTNTGIFIGNGAGLTNITGANVTGNVANATYAINAGSATTAGTVTTNAQPNITSLGNLTSLTVNSTNIKLGSGAVTYGSDSIAIGNIANAGNANSLSADSISIGGSSLALDYSISIGTYAGKFGSNVAANALQSVTIGHGAGYGNTRGNNVVAIGEAAGINQKSYSVALGAEAGINAGANSIAIGYRSSDSNTVYNNTIVLNASGANLNPGSANTLYIKPISTQNTNNVLTYNPTSGLVGYSGDITANVITGNSVVPLANNSGNLGFTGQRWLNIFGNTITAGNISVNNLTFNTSINGNITPNTATSTTVTHKIPIVLNGNTYYIMLTNTP